MKPSNAEGSGRSNGNVRQNAKRRRWLPYAGAAILAGLIVAGLWPKPAIVETAVAARGPLKVTVNEEGRTRVKQRFVVSAPVAGQLRRIPFKAGFEMIQGETVAAVIDPLAPAMLDARTRSLAEARRDTAAANLERAQAAQGFAAKDLQRAEELFAQKTISEQERENSQWREKAAAKDLTAAESALREAEAELAEFGAGNVKHGGAAREPVVIKAPVTGRVLRVLEESSRAVAAGTPLMEVGDPADLEVLVEVLSRDGAAISPGAKVEFVLWGGEKPLEGTVRLVEPSAFTKISALGVEEQRVNVIVDLTSPPEERKSLGDAFRVEARIVVWEANDVVKVSSGALFRRGQQWHAFVVTDGRAALRQVEIGHSNGSETEVRQGLSPGDAVIMYPGDRIGDGKRVAPTKI